jgi:Domain of unknown function (DUF305)
VAKLIHRTGRRSIYIALILGFAAGFFAIVGPGKQLQVFAGQYPICIGTSHSADSGESAFLAENSKAMATMMADMTIKPAGDVDHDFVEMMVPHHGGAIEMAQAELRYGRDARLKRMAQEIIVTQQQEIVSMQMALGRPPPYGPSPF